MLHNRPGDSDEHSEQEHTACQGYDTSLASIGGIVAHSLGQAPSQDNEAQQEGDENVEKDKHRRHVDNGSAPLALNAMLIG